MEFKLEDNLMPFLPLIPERSAKILKLRFGFGCKKHTYKEISKIICLEENKVSFSSSRVRQLVYKKFVDTNE